MSADWRTAIERGSQRGGRRVRIRMDRRTPRARYPRTERSLIGDQGLAPRYMEPIIAGRDLRKSWGATDVLEHADFLLHAGAKLALVGPTGSGKSRLLPAPAGET